MYPRPQDRPARDQDVLRSEPDQDVLRSEPDQDASASIRHPVLRALLTSRLTKPVRDGHSCSRWAKVRSKTRPGRRGTRSHFSKAGISLNGIWIPNFPKRSKAAQNRRKPNETGNFRGNGRPKKNHENRAQKQGQKRVPNPPESGLEKSTQNRTQNTPKIHESLMPALLKRKTVYLRNCTKLR
jgi:hypothetical protein